MVKKIRLIEDEEVKEESEDAVDTPPISSDLTELAKSMDWKLWEILQILQRFEKKLISDEKNKK